MKTRVYCRELPALNRGPAFRQTASHNDYTDNFVSGKRSNNDYTDCRGMSEKLALEFAPFPSRGRQAFSSVNDNTWCMASSKTLWNIHILFKLNRSAWKILNTIKKNKVSHPKITENQTNTLNEILSDALQRNIYENRWKPYKSMKEHKHPRNQWKSMTTLKNHENP